MNDSERIGTLVWVYPAMHDTDRERRLAKVTGPGKNGISYRVHYVDNEEVGDVNMFLVGSVTPLEALGAVAG